MIAVAAPIGSGARVFLNGCRTPRVLSVYAKLSGARVFLNGCRTIAAGAR